MAHSLEFLPLKETHPFNGVKTPPYTGYPVLRGQTVKIRPDFSGTLISPLLVPKISLVRSRNMPNYITCIPAPKAFFGLMFTPLESPAASSEDKINSFLRTRGLIPRVSLFNGRQAFPLEGRSYSNGVYYEVYM